MTTEAQKAKITAAIDGLNEKQVALLAKLNELRSFNAAAWAEYGSELCATEMFRNEQSIAAEIIANKRIKDLLNAFLNGTIVIEEEQALRRLIDTTEQRIRALRDDEAGARVRLEQISLIKSFLQ